MGHGGFKFQMQQN